MPGLQCPGCRQAMRSLDLDRKPAGKLTVDLCGDCQALWFDSFESAQLTPGATLELFRVIHTTTPATRRPIPTDLPCPRCETLLAFTHDPDKIGDGIVALARLESEMERARQRERADIAGIDLVGVGLSALGAFLHWS